MTENELSDLRYVRDGTGVSCQTSLACHVQTHKENYRLSHATKEITVVSTNKMMTLSEPVQNLGWH
jgi:hypothetical protein